MSSQAIIDFLTKQIFIEKNIVTYRSLSREVGIHVNAAKNELAKYHDIAPYQSQTSAATYLLSGEITKPRPFYGERNTQDVEMEYDADSNEEGDYESDGEDVPQTTITLVNERDLEATMARYTRLDSIHVYSLSPTPIYDAGLICSPTEAVREVDNKRGSEMALLVGKIVGENIQVTTNPIAKKGKRPPSPIAGPSKSTSTTWNTGTEKQAAKSIVKEPVRREELMKELPKTTDGKQNHKAKATGKLDFFKTKPKEPRKEDAKAEQSKKESLKPPSISKLKSGIGATKVESKRGVKRKSRTITSDSDHDKDPSVPQSVASSKSSDTTRVKNRTVVSDEESSAAQSSRPSKSTDAVRVKNLTVLSDDDEIYEPFKKGKARLRATSHVDSEAKRQAEALMDVDDDQVTRVSREPPITRQEEEEATQGDVSMAEDIPPKQKPKKKREKVIPVGRNSLKKKRVMKSRVTTDNKGFMVTEDYSSYESVDENEEVEPEVTKKGKAKGKASAMAEPEEDSDITAGATKIKPGIKATSSRGVRTKSKNSGKVTKGSQKSLVGFFAPAKAKN